ncbi:protein-tyrosine phosphatase family protein [Sulfitobacter sp.]|uniref:protein-tyrosine phosphatase family protein n=1 Tax=Sulfitobacter sp. TaxID=1903071 RepID=UPI003002179E
MSTLFPLIDGLPGSLSITLRPKVLLDDLAHLKSSGIDTLISLLEPSEAPSIGLCDEAGSCSVLGMTFINHPIRDMHLPEPESFTRFAADVAQRLRNGSHIALHCHASIGRSGMLACIVLGYFGYTAQTALAHVSQRRGVPVPDTEEQAAFIHHIMQVSQA